MQKSILILSLCSILKISHGQSDTIKHTTRNIIWFTPTKADKINGIAIGPFQSGIFFDKPQTINGLSLTFIGFGVLMPLAPSAPLAHYYESEMPDTFLTKKHISKIKTSAKFAGINGISLSLSGNFLGQVNGISVSLFCGVGSVVNGVCINPFWNINNIVQGISVGAINNGIIVKGLQIGVFNRSLLLHGVQIGIFNKTQKINGIQIGLWNKNQKRGFPLINW